MIEIPVKKKLSRKYKPGYIGTAVSAEMHERIRRFQNINWAEFLRQQVLAALDQLESEEAEKGKP